MLRCNHQEQRGLVNRYHAYLLNRTGLFPSARYQAEYIYVRAYKYFGVIHIQMIAGAWWIYRDDVIVSAVE